MLVVAAVSFTLPVACSALVFHTIEHQILTMHHQVICLAQSTIQTYMSDALLCMQ